MNCLRIPVDGVGFNKFALEEINFRGFSVHEAQFRGFPLNGNKFLGFSRMKLISIDFNSTFLCFMELLMQIGFFHGFLKT